MSCNTLCWPGCGDQLCRSSCKWYGDEWQWRHRSNNVWNIRHSSPPSTVDNRTKSSPDSPSLILVAHIIFKVVFTSTGTALSGVSSPISCTKYCSTKLNIFGPLIFVLVMVSIAVDLPLLDVMILIIGGLGLLGLCLLSFLASNVASTILSALTCCSSLEVAAAAAASRDLGGLFLKHVEHNVMLVTIMSKLSDSSG
jgi:hypothetical protein